MNDSSTRVQQKQGMAFIALEGLDGSGKTTLIELLVDRLKNESIEVLVTREPGGTPLAEDIRNLLLRVDDEVPADRCEILLYQASRAQHVERLIRPHLDKKSWVLCDRFYGSTIAFQCFARGLDRKEVEWLNNYAVNGVHPELTVLLDISVEESVNRRGGRDRAADRLENEKLEFHHKVREGYLAQAEENKETWLVLDAVKKPEELCEELCRFLESKNWLKFSQK